MEEAVGSLTERNALINELAAEHDVPEVQDESPSPSVGRAASGAVRSTLSFVSSLSSSLQRHASPFLMESEEMEDDEDASESLLRDIRQRTKDAAIHVSDTKNVDVNFHVTARKQVRSDWSPGIGVFRFRTLMALFLTSLVWFELASIDTPSRFC